METKSIIFYSICLGISMALMGELIYNALSHKPQIHICNPGYGPKEIEAQVDKKQEEIRNDSTLICTMCLYEFRDSSYRYLYEINPDETILDTIIPR